MGHSNLIVASKLWITQYHPTFLLGHTAPDIQVVSGQKRASTHFYTLPIQTNVASPWEQLLNTHPSLDRAQFQDPEQAIFLAGYLCHLQADWFWSKQIFEPFFGPSAGWKTFRERLYLHNVLRAYLDFRVLESINEKARSDLAQATPKPWLPFIDVDHLETWRDFLADQLKPDASIQTVEVFASRQGISVDAFYHLLNTEEDMQHQIFDFLPRQVLDLYREKLVKNNITFLNEYLSQAGGAFNASS